MSTAEVGTMTTQEVANRFNELAQQGNWDTDPGRIVCR